MGSDPALIVTPCPMMAIPKTHEPQVASVLQRLYLAILSAAVRTKGQLVNGLERLKSQSNLQKDGRWIVLCADVASQLEILVDRHMQNICKATKTV